MKRPAVHLGSALLAAAWTGAASAAMDDPPQPVLARPAIDTAMFRDGEVRRRNETHGRWSLDCDEIPKLAQRYCSLRSLAVDGSGVPVARITVSTDDAGRPAALFDLPAATSLAQPVTLSADHGLVLAQPSTALQNDARRAVAKELARTRNRRASTTVATDILSSRLTPTLCDARGCYAVWSMAPADIAALRAGAGLRLRFDVADGFGGAFPLRLALPSRSIDAAISSDGFGEALAASLR